MTQIDECWCCILQGIVCEAVRKSWLEQWEQSETRRETRTDEEDLHRDGLSVKHRTSNRDGCQCHCKEEMIMYQRCVNIFELVFVGFKWKLAHNI